ncbi:secondary active sulfate transmembrane transporter [Aureococcus anophagefferens]|nr:secondary active sulfate transmembrane transporter [Aureococcus anophagefferens]
MDTSCTTSAIATAGEDEDPWTILTSFSLRKYIVSSVEFYMNDKEAFKNELLSGVTVAVMQVPESVAFSFVAGVPPARTPTFFLGLITALIGGKPGMISGAAGAMAVVIKDLMVRPPRAARGRARAPQADSGPLSSYSNGDRFQHLLMTVALCGVLQTLCGVFQLAKLVKLISKPCMIGFMNGLGIVIFMAQRRPPTPRAPRRADARAQFINRGLIGVSTRTVGQTEKLSGARPSARPARASPRRRPPSWHVPQVPADGEWGVVFQYAISLTFVGLIESVMTLQAVDEITEDLPSVFRSNQECVAQGVANLVSGLFGAMGGDAMIGHPVISVIPIGTLTGVLFMVVLSTFCFDTFRLLPRIPRADALAIGVVVGSVTLATFDAWNRGASFAVAKTDKKTDGDEVTYSPLAPLFFGTVKDFSKAFAPGSDPKSCVVDLERSAIADYSALVALADVAHRYALVDKRVKIKNASEADAKLARASGPAVAAVADAIDTGEAVGDPDAAPLVADGAGDAEAGVELRAD